jgi:hypothetical protein
LIDKGLDQYLTTHILISLNSTYTCQAWIKSISFNQAIGLMCLMISTKE